MNKDELEAANWQIAHTWADGLGLEYGGVDLGDLSEYSVLTVLGRVQLQAAETAASDGHA